MLCWLFNVVGMIWKKIVAREIKVAFSLKSQPLHFRIGKWVAIILLLYFLNDYMVWWKVLLGMMIAGLLLHFYFRYKTKGWTKSYGRWKYEEVFNVKQK